MLSYYRIVNNKPKVETTASKADAYIQRTATTTTTVDMMMKSPTSRPISHDRKASNSVLCTLVGVSVDSPANIHAVILLQAVDGRPPRYAPAQACNGSAQRQP